MQAAVETTDEEALRRHELAHELLKKLSGDLEQVDVGTAQEILSHFEWFRDFGGYYCHAPNYCFLRFRDTRISILGDLKAILERFIAQH